MPKIITQDECISRFIDKHGDRYDYSLVKYSKMSNSVKIICKVHGMFEQAPNNHIFGTGCIKCFYIKITNEECISRFIDKHGDRYDYSLVNYINKTKLIKIICKEHGIFEQGPAVHWNGSNCPICANNSRSNIKTIINQEECIKRCKITHDDRYDYSFSEYINREIPMKIMCKDHGYFWQNPGNHWRGANCPQCNNKNYSNMAISWLNSFNLDIQHAENGGEYLIPNTRYKVDGYCKETNIVYEFLGDCWHGNLDIYDKDFKCHPFNDKTALELNQEWEDRKQILKNIGYNIEYIWENDYKGLLNE